MKHSERIVAMEALCAEIGIDPEAVQTGTTPRDGTLNVWPESMTPAAREALAAKFGEPTRPTWNKELAEFRAAGFVIRCYSWPWPTCHACGQAIPSESPVA